jgi:hypothetical protein
MQSVLMSKRKIPSGEGSKRSSPPEVALADAVRKKESSEAVMF